MNKSTETRKEEFWKEHIARFKQSGESRKKYCVTHQVSYWSFRDWQKKIEARESGKLVKITHKYQKQEENQSCIEIIVAQNILIRVYNGFDGELLRHVIKELGKHT